MSAVLPETDGDEQPWLLFRLGQEQYALPLIQARRVLVAEPITPVPGAPALILGVQNYQGRLLAVLDTARLLGTPCDQQPQHVVVVAHEGIELGCLVTRVEDIIAVSAQVIQPAGTARQHQACLTGEIRRGQSLVGLLDVPALIQVAAQ